MGYNALNYTKQGGAETVIGGTLTVEGTLDVREGATLNGLPAAEHQADSAATTIAELRTDFNALLAKLTAAGLMASDDPET